MKKIALKYWIIAGAALILGIAIFFIIFFNRKVVVPDVTQINITEATKTVKKSGLKLKTTSEYSDTILKDIVISQSINGGTKAKYGTEITLAVSMGIEQITVPNVKNCTVTEAETALKERGFQVNIEEDFSDTLEKGKVIIQSIKGEKQADKGSVITITVSKGPDLVTMPQIEGMILKEAEQLLESTGLKIKTETQFSNTVEEGCVISQNIEANKQVKRNSVVYTKISAGVANTKGTTPSNANNFGKVTTQGNWVYFAGSDNAIYRMRNDKTQIQRICNATAVSLNVVGDWIYYADGTLEGGIYKVKLDGTNKTKLSNAISYRVYVENDWIYYTSKYWGGILYKMKTDGSQSTKLLTEECREYIVHNGYIYYTSADDGLVYKCNTDGQGKTILCPGFAGSNLALVGEKLAVSGSETIYYVNLDGSGFKKYKKNNAQFSFLNGYDGWLYYLEHNFNNGSTTTYFGRMKPNGSQKTNIFEYKFLNHANTYLIVAGDWIYFQNEHQNDDLYRVKIDGTKVERVG